VVHHPSIYAFPAPKLKNTGVAIVVAPGGGHSRLVIDKEGWEGADWLNKNGISAFVLKYRLARAPGSHYTVAEDALADASRAMSLVRSHAADWDINPERIGIMVSRRAANSRHSWKGVSIKVQGRISPWSCTLASSPARLPCQRTPHPRFLVCGSKSC